MAGVREIVFDTETTGFDARGDDRITEIGCIEVIDFIPTGQSFHAYINPERDIPDKVTEITGLTREFLSDKPVFKDRAQDFIDFVKDSNLVAHNADFDRGFINAELERAGYDPIATGRFKDTLKMARAQFPGSPASLDALCKRFQISLVSRNKHGALIDAELLAEVYLELSGGRMRKLGLQMSRADAQSGGQTSGAMQRPTALAPLSTQDERARHSAYIQTLGETTPMLWQTLYGDCQMGQTDMPDSQALKKQA